MSINFKHEQLKNLPDIIKIHYSKYSDNRGLIWSNYHGDFFTSFCKEGLYFNHDKFSTSKKNVLRGFHGDFKTWKLVSCLTGNIFIAIVDNRKSSNTLYKCETHFFDQNDNFSFLIPPGFGLAYLALSELALVSYKFSYIGDYSDVNDQFTLSWNDPSFQINWPVKDPILSDRDRRALYL